MSTTNFKYKLAYKCKNKEECNQLAEELEKIGYKCSETYGRYHGDDYMYLSTCKDGDKPNLFIFTTENMSTSYGRFSCDSKELFIALASIRDSDELYVGEYVWENWTQSPYYKIKPFKVTKVEDGMIYTNRNIESYSFAKNYIKLSKEEIIQHFSKKTMVKEDKTDLIFGKWKVGDTLDIPKQNYKYFCNHWKNGKDAKLEEAEFPTGSSGSIDIVIKSEIYEGEEYLCFDPYLESTSYFMIPKSELIKNGILTEEKTQTKSQEMNKKFKNKLAVKGDRVLLEALAIKFVELGYIPSINNGKYDWLEWNKTSTVYLKTYEDGEYAYHNHYSSYSEVLLELPQDWNKALELAKEEVEKLIEGKWYLSTDKEWLFKFKSLSNRGVEHYHAVCLDDNSWYHAGYFSKDTAFTNATLADSSIIQEALIKEAKKRGFKEGVRVNSLVHNKPLTCTNVKDNTNYYQTMDKLHFGLDHAHYVVIYNEGKWAEIIPSTPDITINGYKAKFEEDEVEFGCQKISIEVIKEIYRLQRELDVDLTKEASNIKQIVDYYQSK